MGLFLQSDGFNGLYKPEDLHLTVLQFLFKELFKVLLCRSV